MECPVCIVRKAAYITFSCSHSVCRTCVLHMINHQQTRCPLCRADIYDQIPQELLDELEDERAADDPTAMGSRNRRITTTDDGYDSADEIEDDATHIKIRFGAREIGFLRNDGIPKTITYDDGTVSFRIEYKNRKCYLFRKDFPDAAVPLNPLSSLCAALPPPPPIPGL